MSKDLLSEFRHQGSVEAEAADPEEHRVSVQSCRDMGLEKPRSTWR